jgi:hypothetical protein
MRRTGPRAGLAAAAVAAASLCACASGPLAMYEGALHARADDAVLAPAVRDAGRRALVKVLAIDGVAVNPASVTEFRLAPGPHELRLGVSVALGGLLYEADARVAFVARAGHTYLPEGTIGGARGYGQVVDAGRGYPERCLPAHRALLPGRLQETPEQAAECELPTRDDEPVAPPPPRVAPPNPRDA